MGDLKGGDGEVGAVGAVEDPNDCAGDGCEEDEEEDGKGYPEAEGTAAAAAAAGAGLGAVGGTCGVVELGFVGREGWVACGSGGAVDGGLGGWIDSVGHGLINQVAQL